MSYKGKVQIIKNNMQLYRILSPLYNRTTKAHMEWMYLSILAIELVQCIHTKYEPNAKTAPAKGAVSKFIPAQSITAIATKYI